MQYMNSMKKVMCAAICLILFCFSAGGGNAESLIQGAADAEWEQPVSWVRLLCGMAYAYEQPSKEAYDAVIADACALDSELALALAEHFGQVWLNDDDPVYLSGQDDPQAIPATGRHAIVVLGYALQNGKMTDELIRRCDAAAELAKAFPDSLIVLSGGATGLFNLRRHTEAELMMAYMTQVHGLSAERIRLDEKASNTAENAVNVLAILREEDVESMTVVTSDYHLRRSRTLFFAMAEKYRLEYGYRLSMTGNYCCHAERDGQTRQNECLTALYQLGTILDLPLTERIELLALLFGGQAEVSGA